jgi:hypothetical protein
MSVEVSCPKCAAVLRAPDGMGGKKVRCKKCQTSFRLPGPVPADSVNESVGLSVVDEHLTAAPPASADPFAFDTGPAAALPPAPAAADIDRFAIPTPTDATPAPDKSKSKYRGKEPPRPKPGKPGEPADKPAKRSKLPVILGGLFGVGCAAGGAAAVFFLLPGQSPTQTVAQATPTKPAPAAAAPTPTAGKADKQAPAGEQLKAKEKTESPRSPRRSPTVMIADGLALPAAPAQPGEVVQTPETTTPVAVEPAKVRRVLLSKAEARLAAVVYPSVPPFQGKGAKDAVEQYGLGGGARVGRIEIDADGLTPNRPADLSPEGHLYASEGPPGKVSVWDIGQNQKLLDGVDPPEGGGVVGVFFVEEEKLAVVSKAGAVDVWVVRNKAKEVTGKPLAAMTPADVLADRRNVVLAPDRRAVLVVAGGAVHRVKTTGAGDAETVFTLPGKGGVGYAVGADPLGERVVVLYQATEPAPHTMLVMAKLGTDKPTIAQPLAADAGTAGRADWIDDQNALVVTDKDGVGLLVNAELNRVVAAVRPAAKPGLLLPQSSAGRLGCLLPDAKDAKKSVLVSIPFPPDGYQSIRDAGKDKPIPLTVAADGLRR